MRTRSSSTCIAAALLSVVGCGSFGQDRALDFAQSFDVAAGWSEGLEVNVRATKVLQVGIGAYRGIYWCGLKDGVFDVWMEERSEFGIGPLYEHEVFRAYGKKLLDIDHPLFGDPGFRERSWDIQHLTDRGWFDFGATANVAIIGFDVAFKGEEFFDFCAGCFGYDPLQDDVHVPEMSALVSQLENDDARIRAAAARAILLRRGDAGGYAIYTAPREFPYRQGSAIRTIREELEIEAGTAEVKTAPPADVPAPVDAGVLPPNDPPSPTDEHSTPPVEPAPDTPQDGGPRS